MKYGIRYLFTALLSALLTVGLFKYFDQPETIIIRERVSAPSTLVSNPDNGSVFVRRKIIESSSKPKTKIFEDGIKALVQIKSGKKNWFGRIHQRPLSQNGSGVLISHNGYIISNYHVIEDSDEINIQLWNKEQLPAQLIGYDAKTDLALLKIDKENLPYLTFGDSDLLSLGEKVYALGHPFRMEATLTQGIISGLHRQLGLTEDYGILESFIQTDAVINPGNSGGALINEDGMLIGINTAILTRSGNFEGYSFAIPGNLAHKVVSDLRTYGYVQRGILGIKAEYQALTTPPHSAKYGGGTLIHEIDPNSPAEKSGLKHGDLILSINQKKVTSVSHLKEILWSTEVGAPLKITYLRAQKVDSVNVQLIHESDNPDYILLLKFGIEIRPLQENEIEKYQLQGIRVESIFKNSMAETLNIKPGFIITHINRIPVSETRKFYTEFVNSEGDIQFIGHYPPDKQNYYYSFNIQHLFQ